MPEPKWRVYRKGGRTPRDFCGTVHAPTAEAAIASMLKQPAYKNIRYALDAVLAHEKPRIPGK